MACDNTNGSGDDSEEGLIHIVRSENTVAHLEVYADNIMLLGKRGEPITLANSHYKFLLWSLLVSPDLQGVSVAPQLTGLSPMTCPAFHIPLATVPGVLRNASDLMVYFVVQSQQCSCCALHPGPTEI